MSMRILGIETSCDETAVAIIDVRGRLPRPRIRVLANVIASQVKLHAKFGGVVPNLAKREHQRNLISVFLQALSEAKLKNSKFKMQNAKLQFKVQNYVKKLLERDQELLMHFEKHIPSLQKPEIDVIAVTVGPGLAPALWVGVNFAKALSYFWDKQLIPVNHLEGHIYTNLLPTDQSGETDQDDKVAKRLDRAKRFIGFTDLIRVRFPALCLIVSGGHTELVLMSGYGKYRVIGETLDDAAGEAFDKVAKMLGLGFPGGPTISAVAEMELKVKSLKLKVNLPRPMINSQDFNFSFSGLKTAVLYLLRDLRKTHSLGVLRPLVAKEFQQAVVDVLVAKTIRAARQYRVKTVMIGGGVAANKKLRHELARAIKRITPSPYTLFPIPLLTGDNALMIALAGWFNRNKKMSWKNIEAYANLRLDESIK